MLTEPARVVSRDGRRVEVELQRGSACGGCELSEGCGTGALGRLLGHRRRSLVIETDRDCNPGDEVLLSLPEAALVKASLMLYGLPLLGLLVGGSAAISLSLAEWWVAFCAILGLFAGFRLAARGTQKLEQGGLAPYISDIRVNPGPVSRS
jgi:sigma-E factor negative regulatory protein RseC